MSQAISLIAVLASRLHGSVRVGLLGVENPNWDARKSDDLQDIIMRWSRKNVTVVTSGFVNQLGFHKG